MKNMVLLISVSVLLAGCGQASPPSMEHRVMSQYIVCMSKADVYERHSGVRLLPKLADKCLANYREQMRIISKPCDTQEHTMYDATERLGPDCLATVVRGEIVDWNCANDELN